MDLSTACHHEVIELHQFFEDWFNGQHPREEAPFARFRNVLANTFRMVHPDGLLLERATVLDRVYQGCGPAGGVADPMRISIKELFVQPVGELAIVTYEEWQERDRAPARGRISTAVFQPQSETPNGVEWLQLHETWKSE